ncbi:MAG: winged helix-turn-helix transcriptional regulator [Theionarchaea archaeon]|nr:winged helix-turn-helix transcriptional regulator [Theionarchaea archaeon]
MEEEEKLANRMENLEKLVESLREETVEIKSMVEGLSERLPLTVKNGGKINPWTQEVQEDIMKALESLKQSPPARFSRGTFRPTIEALKKKKEGMTASEVGDITGRKRNTESFYLKRLYLAGITRRWVSGREVVYSLTTDSKIIEKYSDLLT